MQNQPKEIIVDIISDVVCPWCVIGYRRLEAAAFKLKDQAKIRIKWHPFELTPDMSDQGENLRVFLKKKYGNAFNGSDEVRKVLTDFGESLDFTFRYSENSMRYNSFKAHQLLHHARRCDLEHALKVALFVANFTDNKNISDTDVLADVAAGIGMDADDARKILKKQQYVQAVREEQRYWKELGVVSIPLFVFNQSESLQGAVEEHAFREKILTAMQT